MNAAGNNNARMMLARDIDNMARYFGRSDPEILESRYAQEIWALYQGGQLSPEVELTGTFEESSSLVDLDGVLEAIEEARRENEEELSRKTPVETAGGVEHAAKEWNPRAKAHKPAPSPAKASKPTPKPEPRPIPVVTEPAPAPVMKWGRRPHK